MKYQDILRLMKGKLNACLSLLFAMREATALWFPQSDSFRSDVLKQHPAFGWRFIVAIVCAASLTAAITTALNRATRTPLNAIAAAASSVQFRPVDGRISGVIEYRALKPSGQVIASAAQDRHKLLRGVLEAQQRTGVSEYAGLHAIGVGHLLLEDFDGAVSTLEGALLTAGGTRNLDFAVAHSHSADLLNDLACAYLARGQGPQRDSDYLRAVAAAERSWLLQKTAPSAWNRALAYEALYLKHEASAAWSDVLALEQEDGWREEAALRQRALAIPTEEDQWRTDKQLFLAALHGGDRRQLERYGRQYASQLVAAANDRLTQWAAHSKPENLSTASAALREARLISEALGPADPFWVDAVGTIDTAMSAGDSARLARLIQGILLLDQGRRLYKDRRLEEALGTLREAATVLDQSRSNLAMAARILAASCLVISQRYPEARAEIEKVTHDAVARHRYPRAFAHAEWIAGLALLAVGRPYEALQAYAAAHAVFDRAGDTASLAAIEDLQGEAYEHLGMGEESWRHRRRALALNAVSGATNRSEAIFGGAARAAIKLGHDSVALQLVDSVLPDKQGDASALAELLVLRGAIHERLGFYGEATRDFRDAERALVRVPAGAARDAVANDIRAVQLLVGVRASTEAADAAIAAAALSDNRFRLVPLLRRRAMPAATAGIEASMQAAQAALSEMETQLSTVHDTDIRLTAQRSLQDLYDSLIATSVARGDIRRAMELLDCQREHNRLGSSGAPCTPISFDAITGDLALLDYAVIGDAVFIFSIHHGTLAVYRVPKPAATIDKLARELVDAIQSDNDERARALASDLAAELFDPFAGNLRRTGHIVIGGSPASVPVPFGALWSRRTGRFLIEDWTITYAPGVSRLVSAMRRDLELRNAAPPEIELFSIAPAYGGHSDLPPLPSAAHEADLIRQMYQGAGVTGAAATSETFRRIGRTAAIIHFAGHSIANGQQPRYSALALGDTTSDSEPDMLYAHEIAATRFPATRMVVLASCSSATSGDRPSVAPTSLSDAFLDAQVPAAVGTMWAVGDAETTSLLRDFHQDLRAGRAAPAALRHAQIAALRSGDLRRSRLQQWAPYCFIGWHTGK